jgi:hypothetical protein
MGQRVATLGTLALLAGCGLLNDAFGSVRIAVRGPELLEEVRYVATEEKGALLAEGRVFLRDGQAEIAVPVPRGGAKVVLEGQYGGFTYFKAEVRASTPLDRPLLVELDASTRRTVSPTLFFAHAPEDTGGDEVVVCLERPIFAPSLRDPDCSPGFGGVALAPGGTSVPLSRVPAGPRYEVLYRTPTRVYRGVWTQPEAPTWRFDLQAMPSGGR